MYVCTYFMTWYRELAILSLSAPKYWSSLLSSSAVV